jgi:hypothetical protein
VRIRGPDGSCDVGLRFAAWFAGNGTTGLNGIASRITETISHFSEESELMLNAE